MAMQRKEMVKLSKHLDAGLGAVNGWKVEISGELDKIFVGDFFNGPYFI